jgi:hypothetical protein
MSVDIQTRCLISVPCLQYHFESVVSHKSKMLTDVYPLAGVVFPITE